MPTISVDLAGKDQDGQRKVPSLLIVEDEVIVAEDVRRRLEEMGYTVVGVAARAEQALVQALRERPDLILMDIGLKGELDGVDAAKQILAEMDIPIVFASAYSDDATLRRAKTIDPFGFVLKPFDERELHTAIEIGLYKHQTERRLRERENHYRSLVELASDGIATLDLHGSLLFCNSRKALMHGFSDAGQLTGKSAMSFVAPEDLDHAREVLGRVMSGERLVDEVVTMLRTDGSRFMVEITASLITGLPGDALRIMCIEHDVTRRKEREQEQGLIAESLALIVDGMDDGLLLEDAVHTVRLANAAFCRMFGFDGSVRITGRPMDHIMDEMHRQFDEPGQWVERMNEVRSNGTAVTGDIVILRDGRKMRRDYLPLRQDGRLSAHIWHYHLFT